jgi:hypothetical protein
MFGQFLAENISFEIGKTNGERSDSFWPKIFRLNLEKILMIDGLGN